MFITFEGIDGSGKSTQARLLAAHLEKLGHEVILTREPGGSVGAEEIRALVLEGDPARWSSHTELLLFTAARRDHLERVIEPGLARGAIVVCDRYVDSTRVYQGASREDLRRDVDALHALMIKREADLTVLIDMDPQIGLGRALGRGGTEDRFEEFGSAMQVTMRSAFLSLAEDFANRFITVDGNRSIEQVADDVAKRVLERLPT
ncbi:MAG: dTMP kinase [Rhodobacteraceae bacterium]|nr:dTMP kinase [Paracoccaceae bacterium]